MSSNSDEADENPLTHRPCKKIYTWKEREVKRLKEVKQSVLDDAVNMYLTEVAGSYRGIVSSKTIPKIIKELGHPPWLTRDQIYYEVKKKRNREKMKTSNALMSSENFRLLIDAANDSERHGIIPTYDFNSVDPIDVIIPTDEFSINDIDDNDRHENPSTIGGHNEICYDTSNKENASPVNATKIFNRSIGGKPKGSAEKALKLQSANQEVLFLASEAYKKELALNINGKLVNGTLDTIINECGKKVGLDEHAISKINKKTIQQRVRRNNTRGIAGSYSNTSPMQPVEGLLVSLCIELNRHAKSIDMRQFLALANSIIRDKEIERNVIEYKRKICGISDTNSNLDKKYFYDFKNRHKDKIRFCKSKKKNVKRKEWGTYENVQKLYDLMYQQFEDENICIKLDTPVWRNKEGKKVDNEAEAFGLKSDLCMIHPEYLIFVDEVGSNTNMKHDKQVGNKRVIAEAGFSGEQEAAMTDNHYTVLGFTAATGNPVMCVVIFASSTTKTLPGNWVTGIDINSVEKNGITSDENVLNDEDLIESMAEKGSVLGGGPVCTFGDKEVQSMIAFSPHGGITSAILTECLRQMDIQNLFPRVSGLGPFLLLDGHGSRFELDFLQYLRDFDWACCFGLPYSTHLWQVGDKTQQNGRYKAAEYDGKNILLQNKIRLNLALVFSPTDIIPIVNYAWDRSFALQDGNRSAISECGWNPCNYAVLTVPEVLRTKYDGNIGMDEDCLIENNSSIDIDVPVASLNLNTEVVANTIDLLLHARNDKKVQERCRRQIEKVGRVKKVLDRTKKLTSGPAFARGMIALHKPGVLEHQKEYQKNKKLIENKQKINRRAKFEKDKVNADKIRSKDPLFWSNADISKLLTYKRLKGDQTNKSANGERGVLMQRWEARKHRGSPTCSPVNSDNEENEDNGEEVHNNFQNTNILHENDEHENDENNENTPLSVIAI